jgi:O-methyltransferase
LVQQAVRSEEYRVLTSKLNRTEIAGRVYEQIAPASRYAPWRSDGEFLEIYDRIVNHTLVDLYRCWNLWSLVRQVAKRIGTSNHFVEIGVWRGGTGVLIAQAMSSRGLAQPVYLCDTFQGVTKTSSADPYYHGGEHADTSLDVVTELAAAAGLKPANYEICVGIFPDDMPRQLRSGKFAFAHIDVDAYESAKDCFAAIWPRTVSGGVVVFDDYGFQTTTGVAQFVDENSYLSDGMFMYNLTGQAVLVKI